MKIFQKIKSSFSRKLLIFLLPLFFIYAFVFTFSGRFVEKKYLINQLLARGESMVKILSLSTQLGVYSGDENILEQNANSMFFQEDIKFIFIYNNKRKIIFHKEKIPEVKILTKYQYQQLIKKNLNIIRYKYKFENEEIYTFWVPIIFTVTSADDEMLYFEEGIEGEKQEKAIGIVGIGITSENLYKHLAASNTNNLWVAILFILISYLLLSFILAKLTNPLTQLIQGIQGVVKGDYSKRIKIDSSDEMGILATEYNLMLGKLQNNVKRLEAAQTTTESAYNQLIKTSEALEESNLKLTSRIEQLTALREINEAVTPEKARVEIFKLLLKKIVHTIDIERGALFEYHPEDETIKGVFILGDQNITSKQFSKISFPADDNNLISQTFKDNEFYFITDLRDDPRWKIEELKSKSCGIFPVSTGEEVFGVLFVDNPYSSRVISNEDIQTLVTFSETAGLALHNLILYQRLKKQLAAVEEKNIELMKLDQLKSDFLANVSHELRTPLTSIKGYTEYILSKKLGPLTDKQERGLQVSSRNIHRLMQLINDLLDFTKIESGKEKIEVKPFVLDTVLSDVLHSFRNEIKNKKMNIDIETPDNLPSILGDKGKIAQVIENLFKNSMKFTPEEGTIRINAHWNLGGGKKVPDLLPNKVRITVSDTGIGIKKSELSKIFKRFYQVDGSSRRKYGGTGLGLAIVQSILAAHRSKIEVESEEGKGTKFVFDLELEMKDYEVKTKEKKLIDFNVGASKNKVILVIDDEQDIINVMRLYLEEKGFTIVAAETGYQGIEFARLYKPDLIILDILLPDIDGYKVLDVLSNDSLTKDIPVIILSILKDVMKGKDYEIYDYLAKPFDRTKMLDTIWGVFKGRPKKDKYKIYVVDDEKDTTDMLKMNLTEDGFDVEIAYSAKELYLLMKANIPDLILLDIMMPEIDGWEVIETLKDDDKYRDVPIIVISAKTSVKDKDRGLQLGAIEYLTKPFKVENVLKEIKSIIEKNII
ncbi:response regulator [Candidatus Dependentiae bacterium]|nr:response regulator [Candidatus Dependentiae bacterium]